MRFHWYETIIAPINWKVAVEAFNEGYHVGATHNTEFDWHPLRARGLAHGRHASFNSTMGPTRIKDWDTGEWRMAAGPGEQIYASNRMLHKQWSGGTSDLGMLAWERVRKERPADAPAAEVMPLLFKYYREEIEATGAKWPEKLTMENMVRADVDWHIFPNTVFLPAIDSVIWYRMRPHPKDEDQCIFDIWSLRRYAPGQEPRPAQFISVGFEAFKGRNTFLEQDIGNLEGANKGMKSRGWAGAFANPKQEFSIIHFHRMLREFMAD
jgi:phenylpropionate dioxygenase-like ring-hydroxylating dioxygenase large terminal subunit